MSLQAGLQAERVRATLERVLIDEEIGTREEGSWLRWLLEKLGLDGAVGAGWPVFVRVALYLGVCVLVALLALQLARWLRARRGLGTRAPADALVGGADPALSLREAARAAEAAGRYAEALRLELAALVQALARGSGRELRRAWTLRECLEHERLPPELHARVHGLVLELEPHIWGERPTRAADLARLRGAAREFLNGGRA